MATFLGLIDDIYPLKILLFCCSAFGVIQMTKSGMCLFGVDHLNLDEVFELETPTIKEYCLAHSNGENVTAISIVSLQYSTHESIIE